MRRPSVGRAKTWAAVRDEIHGTREGRYHHRLHAVLLVLGGRSCHEVAGLYGDAPRTIQHWVHQVTLYGPAALKEGTRPGRPPRLSSLERAKLHQELAAGPRSLGYHQDHWDGQLLSQHVSTHYQVRLGVRQCQRLLAGGTKTPACAVPSGPEACRPGRAQRPGNS